MVEGGASTMDDPAPLSVEGCLSTLIVSPAWLRLHARSSSTQGTMNNTLLNKRAVGGHLFRAERTTDRAFELTVGLMWICVGPV